MNLSAALKRSAYKKAEAVWSRMSVGIIISLWLKKGYNAVLLQPYLDSIRSCVRKNKEWRFAIQCATFSFDSEQEL